MGLNRVMAADQVGGSMSTPADPGHSGGMTQRRPKLATLTFLVLTAIAAIVIAVNTHPVRQVARTKSTYDAQKGLVDDVATAYISDLTIAGYTLDED